MKKQSSRRSEPWGRCLAVICMVFALGAAASMHRVVASTVLAVGLDEMLQNSELVFEGEVTDVTSGYADVSRRKIYTYVTFEITEVIKGTYDDKFITLRYLGGTVDDRTLEIGDMQLPDKGEHGLYFVETLSQGQVHPLFGWSQGHLLIKKDPAGIERILSSNGAPVGAVDQQRLSAPRMPGNGIARGLLLQRETRRAQPISATEFKSVLRNMLGNTGQPE